MSRVSPAQTSFNGGEVSQRLRARIDQSLYGISCAAMVGFAPLVEGPAEAMPGTIHVAQALGPCRLVRFEYSTTQGHVLEFSHLKVRVFTNDALIATIDSPYTWEQVQGLTFHQSYDVLYCCHPALQTREFYRSAPDAFGFDLLELKRGPFEPRNADESVVVSASGVDGVVTLLASCPAEPAKAEIFAPGDVGGMFRIETRDFGDITAWEPYITVTQGQLLTANDRVYRVVGGNPDGTGKIRTGTLTPIHTEGVEWDGIAKGVDINDKPAGGVRLEYLHDRWGELKITGYTSGTQVAATVTRRLPFSATEASSYDYTGGYYDGSYDVYVPPVTTVAYAYGSYRWSFGAFSDTRGWPRCACIFDERLCLGKDSTVYASVAADLNNFAERNELGDVSNGQAFTALLKDPNPILHLVATDKLLALTSAGVHALTPASAANGIGPGNVRAWQQNDAGSGTALPSVLDSRTLHIDRSGRRIYETDADPSRNVEQEIDLTRYARHIGAAQLVELAVQQNPFNHLWAVRGDGSLALAAYLPEEQVLGWAPRAMADGVAARSICACTDPAGLFEQVWIAAEYAGAWHVLRMAPWREDGDSDTTACMVDFGAEFVASDEDPPRADFTHPVIRNATVHVVADGAFYEAAADADGAFTIPERAAHVWAGLPFPAYIESLDFEHGGDNGPARGRKARFGKAWIETIAARGLKFGVPGDMADIEQLTADQTVLDEGYAPESEIRLRDAAGDWTRHPRLRVERVAPFQGTIAAWGGELNMEKL
jgi:hypothetical protein